jgi:tRNA (adenine22-N1)-methyltransferase
VRLCIENRIKRAIATDINKGPLEFADALISENGLQDRIKTVLTNGIIGVDLSDVTDVSICGMGGELISEILEQSFCLEYSHINFVLNPMSRDSELRRYLFGRGFKITEETVVVQSGRVYAVMSAKFTGKEYFPSETELLIGGLRGKTESERMYIEKVLKRLKKQLLDIEKREKSEILIKEIEEITK